MHRWIDFHISDTVYEGEFEDLYPQGAAIFGRNEQGYGSYAVHKANEST